MQIPDHGRRYRYISNRSHTKPRGSRGLSAHSYFRASRSEESLAHFELRLRLDEDRVEESG